MPTLNELEEEILSLQAAENEAYQVLTAMDTGIEPMSDAVRSKFVELERQWQALCRQIEDLQSQQRVLLGLA